MEKYQHITKMEEIMIEQRKILKELNQSLNALQARREEYKELINYYYSDQRAQDLEDDIRQLIPSTLHRGVLSEDELYDLMGDHRDTAIRMLEIAVQMIKD